SIEVDAGPPKCERLESPNVTVDPNAPAVAGSGAAGTGRTGMGGGIAGSGATGLQRGSMTMAFTTTPPRPGVVGFFDKGGPPLNAGAVWITDAEGRYVKTLDHWGTSIYSMAKLSRYTKFLSACSQDADVTSRATLRGHMAHQLAWNGTNFAGKI